MAHRGPDVSQISLDGLPQLRLLVDPVL